MQKKAKSPHFLPILFPNRLQTTFRLPLADKSSSMQESRKAVRKRVPISARHAASNPDRDLIGTR